MALPCHQTWLPSLSPIGTYKTNLTPGSSVKPCIEIKTAALSVCSTDGGDAGVVPCSLLLLESMKVTLVAVLESGPF